jgi:hypothetical protein
MRRVQVTLSGVTANVGSVRRVKQESWIFSSTRESHLVPAGTKSPSRPKRLVHGLRTASSILKYGFAPRFDLGTAAKGHR